MSDAVDLIALVREYAQEKAVITHALERLVALEEQIGAVVGFCKTEGSETYDRSSKIGSCKFTMKQPIYTKVDSVAWPKLRAKLAAKHPARGIFRTKYELDTKKARALQDAKDEAGKQAWREVADVITRKPGKVAFEVKSLVLVPPSHPVQEMAKAMRDVPLPSDREPNGEIARDELAREESNEGLS